MSYWNFAELKRRIREIIGRYSPLELTDAELGRAINQYYQLNFPQEALLDGMLTVFSFYTQPFKQQYLIDVSECKSFLPEAWCNDTKILFSQRLEENFFSKRLKTITIPIGLGNGQDSVFAFKLDQTPISPNSLIIQSHGQAIADLNSLWNGDSVALATPPDFDLNAGSGSVNYLTGEGAVTFIQPPALGELIEATYAPLVKGVPESLVLYNNYFYLFPAPDRVYRIQVKGYKGLSPLLTAGDVLERDEWGLTICYGTAKNLCAAYGELDAYAELDFLHRDVLTQVRRSTQENIRIQRPRSLF